MDAVVVDRMSGELTLIDWKTSGKRRATLASTFDAPLQLAAYAGACNADPRHRFRLRRASVVVVRGDGRGPEANAIAMDEHALEEYWQKWMRRLKTYRRMKEYQ